MTSLAAGLLQLIRAEAFRIQCIKTRMKLSVHAGYSGVMLTVADV